MAEFTYEVTERIAVLSTNARGWERQLNMVSWNGNPPKYDIRDWSPDGSRMAKGISLTEEELKTLKEHPERYGTVRFAWKTTAPGLWRSTIKITRPGADRLLSWLETTDFFTALPPPATTVPVSAAWSCTA